MPKAAELLQTSHPTASRALRTLEKEGLVHQASEDNYSKLYAYTSFLDILNEE